MNILFIITGLSTGGAELMLDRLVRGLNEKGVRSTVCTLTGLGEVGRSLQKRGIEVYSVDMAKSPLSAIFQIRKIIRAVKPDLVHTWLYHADLLGGIATRTVGRTVPGTRLVWSIRNGRLHNKFSTSLVAHLCTGLSRVLPDAIVACAHSAKSEHVRKGYPAERIQVIPNGFDTDRFFPDAQKRREVRNRRGVSDDTVVFGLVGRYDPNKNHVGFIRSVAHYVKRCPQSRALFVLCGVGVDDSNRELLESIDLHNLRRWIQLAGPQSEIEACYQAFDVIVSASTSEGFSNVIGEAMACGKPCIVTDVGDSRDLIGAAGIVVPAGDTLKMSEAIQSMTDMAAEERSKMGALGLDTIRKNFSLSEIIDRYIDFYRKELLKCAA